MRVLKRIAAAAGELPPAEEEEEIEEVVVEDGDGKSLIPRPFPLLELFSHFLVAGSVTARRARLVMLFREIVELLVV